MKRTTTRGWLAVAAALLMAAAFGATALAIPPVHLQFCQQNTSVGTKARAGCCRDFRYECWNACSGNQSCMGTCDYFYQVCLNE